MSDDVVIFALYVLMMGIVIGGLVAMEWIIQRGKGHARQIEELREQVRRLADAAPGGAEGTQ